MPKTLRDNDAYTLAPNQFRRLREVKAFSGYLHRAFPKSPRWRESVVSRLYAEVCSGKMKLSMFSETGNFPDILQHYNDVTGPGRVPGQLNIGCSMKGPPAPTGYR